MSHFFIPRCIKSIDPCIIYFQFSTI